MADRPGPKSVFGAWLWFIVFALLPAAAFAQGMEVCKGCHEDHVDAFAKTIHGNAAYGKTPAAQAQGCGSCHGDLSKHVAAKGGSFEGVIRFNDKSIPAGVKAGQCLGCHTTTRSLAFWDAGQHKKNDVSCNNCHSVHQDRTPGNDKMLKLGSTAGAGPYRTTMRQLAYETCVSCHREQRAQILKPSHHPIVEGKIQCHDCHNPHGAMTPVMLKAESYQDLCQTCHTDKRGPWIHEHPPVMENCATCHTPHGSAHNRLLAQKPPALCADCHPGGHTHGLYDGRGKLPGTLPSNIRFEGSGCVNCHRQIHGSNAPSSAFGQFFLR